MTDTTDWKAEAERLRAERNRAKGLFDNMASKHARLAAWARETLPEELQAQFFGVLANGAPDWRTAPRNLAVDLLAATAERDAALAKLAQAREVLRDAREMLIGDPHLYRGQCPQPNDTDARDPECPACATLVRIDAALAVKGE